MFQSVLRALRESAENIVRTLSDADEIWELDDPFLDGGLGHGPQTASIYD